MSWEVVTLDEVCSTQYGYTASATEDAVGPKFLRITDIVPDAIDWRSVPYCQIDESSYKKYKLNVGDIVIARTGNTTGYAKLIREQENAVFASYLVRLKLDLAKCVPGFVGRLIESSHYKQYVNSVKGGAAQGNANARTLTLFKFRLPPTDVQERIAEILEYYDDLIENNRRRIQLMEESARLLYKEWFVQMRFPGHEHVKIIDGVPEGWERKNLDELCYQVKVSIDPSEVEEGTPYIGLEHIPRRSITLSEWETAEKVTSGKYSYQEGDIIFGKIRPYFHKVGFALTSGITSSDAIVIRPHQAKHYAYLLMLISSDQFVALASQTVKEGSKMPRADWTFLSQQYFLVPSGSLLEVFQEQIATIVKQLKVLSFQNKQLAQARDILLPRLLNGELAV
ncbi:restriction endonuclease subunit S [Sideroxydans sp.]